MNRLDKFDQASFHQDAASLNNLRQGAQANDEKAMRKAAEHFESIFMRMMLKSMRQAEEVLSDKDSPFNSQNSKFYRDMHDDQMALEISSMGALGLADLIVEQMMPQKDKFMPAQSLRGDASLVDAQNQSLPAFSLTADQIKQSNRLNLNSDSDSNKSNIHSTNTTDTANTQWQAQKAAQSDASILQFESKQDFVDKLLPIAEKIAMKLGLPPVAMVAQAALETGWGQKMIQKIDGSSISNAFNFFGIKADERWQGDKTTVSTLEFRNGIAQKEKAQFRAYDSIEAGLKDYVEFIKKSDRYQGAIAQADKPDQYFIQLQQAGYATDPQYAEKISRILKDPVFSEAVTAKTTNSSQAQIQAQISSDIKLNTSGSVK